MQPDLISREALLDIVGKMPLDWEYGKAVSDIYDIIKAAPSVDAVILPCKLGDPVYMIRECSCYCADVHKKNKRRKCREKVYLGERLRTYHCGYVSESKFGLKHLADFGKTLFLTREEAEAALAERKMNNAAD